MIAEDGSPHTAHTTNRVPFVVTTFGELRDDGEIADIAPTILSLLRVKEPPQMSGKDLLNPAESELREEGPGLL
jgi:2,3-bisphosphoglycerate-independent phosphoglycerate mutase